MIHSNQGTPSPPGSPWPQPMSLQRGAEVFGMSLDDFSFEGDVSNCDIIEEALKRYEVMLAIVTLLNDVSGEYCVKIVNSIVSFDIFLTPLTSMNLT